MSVVSISMPEALLERLDGFATEHGYTGRSEVVREATRVLLSEFDEPDLEGRTLAATVTVLFAHDSASVEERMRRLRHEHEDIVVSNVHNCIGADHCTELFVLEGSLDSISMFVSQTRATTGVERVEHSILPLEHELEAHA
jgi:CopG family nickel-responsive transcriptional regulator